MYFISAIVFCALISGNRSAPKATFPSWFMFGAASASYQIEGGWNASGEVIDVWSQSYFWWSCRIDDVSVNNISYADDMVLLSPTVRALRELLNCCEDYAREHDLIYNVNKNKGESTWDRLLHSQPNIIHGGVNGDVACDSYHLWKRDIQMCEELGLDMYRFSISWPRLLPSGFPNHISEDGKNYYNNLIDGLLEKGIQPVVTIYHFDLPQSFQDIGGWANPLISDWFADYARVVFDLYADRVKIWLTLNEPFGICDVGYNQQQAPFLNDTEVGRYLCNKNTMIAHAKAWRIYHEEFKPLYHGKVSLSTLFIWYEPLTPEDQDVTELTIQHWEGRYAHPIFSQEGGWPLKIQQFLDESARKEGYSAPRLPRFTAEEIELVKGTYDFYGLNHYTTRKVRKARPGEEIGSWPFYGSKELGIVLDSHNTYRSRQRNKATEKYP